MPMKRIKVTTLIGSLKLVGIISLVKHSFFSVYISNMLPVVLINSTWMMSLVVSLAFYAVYYYCMSVFYCKLLDRLGLVA